MSRGMMAVSFLRTLPRHAHRDTGRCFRNLTWTVTNGAVNAQEVYRDTDQQSHRPRATSRR
jgi:hypothetical protein